MMNRMLITGGSAGIGREVVRQWLASSTENTAIVVDRVAPSQPDDRIVFEECDVRDSKALANLYARHEYGVAINNAGVGYAGFDRWQESLEVNLHGAVVGTMGAIDRFERSGEGGVVVNVASLAGLVPAPFSPVYCAAKAGVVSMVRSLHRQMKKKNIYVYAFCPSFTDTQLVRDILDDGATHAANFVKKATQAQGGLMSSAYIAEQILTQLVSTSTIDGASQRRESLGDRGPVLYVTPQTGAVFEAFPKHNSERIL